MGTLNGGFSLTREHSAYLNASDQALVDEFLRTKGVTVVAPGNLQGNEAARATNLHVTKLRANFRQNKRNAAKASK